MAKASQGHGYGTRGGIHHERVSNRILAALPQGEYKHLFSSLEVVSLVARQVLYEPNEAIRFSYFPNSGLVSLTAVMRNGASVEVGIVGNEGFVGGPVLLGVKSSPNRAVVQIAGTAFLIQPAELASVLVRTPRLELVLRQFIQVQASELAQAAACNRLHDVQARMARWLLMAQDRAGSHLLPLTHERLSEMLGSRRSTVSEAARSLQKTGAVECTRGLVKVRNRAMLESKACECYEACKQLVERYLSV